MNSVAYNLQWPYVRRYTERLYPQFPADSKTWRVPISVLASVKFSRRDRPLSADHFPVFGTFG